MNSQADINSAIAITARILMRRVMRILRGCGLTESQLKSMSGDVIEEIARIKDPQPSRVTARQALMCSDVVLKWRRHCSFLDADGSPKPLSLREGSLTFRELVNSAAPGEDADMLLNSMKELGAVRLTESGQVELMCESVVACPGRDRVNIASAFVLEHICGFLGSVEFNVFDKPSRERGRFERACYASVPRQLVPILQQLVSSRGQGFVDTIDEWLSRRAVKPSDTSTSVLVGAGAYVFVRDNFD